MGGGDTLRHRLRREAHFFLSHNDASKRVHLSPEAAAQKFRSIDKHNAGGFGVLSCVRMEVNELYYPPSHPWCRDPSCCIPWPAVGTCVTWISYAAWRRRDTIVWQLTVGGADPTISDLAPNGCGPPSLHSALRSMTSRSVVYAISQVVRLRSLANRNIYFWERRTRTAADGEVRSISGEPASAAPAKSVSGGPVADGEAGSILGGPVSAVKSISGTHLGGSGPSFHTVTAWAQMLAGSPPALQNGSPPPEGTPPVFQFAPPPPGEPAARCDSCGCSALPRSRADCPRAYFARASSPHASSSLAAPPSAVSFPSARTQADCSRACSRPAASPPATSQHAAASPTGSVDAAPPHATLLTAAPPSASPPSASLLAPPLPAADSSSPPRPAPACGYILRCHPCGCVCCERCLWRVLCAPPQEEWEERGQLRCARCRVAILSPGQPDAKESLDELKRVVKERVERDGGEAGSEEAWSDAILSPGQPDAQESLDELKRIVREKDARDGGAASGEASGPGRGGEVGDMVEVGRSEEICGAQEEGEAEASVGEAEGDEAWNGGEEGAGMRYEARERNGKAAGGGGEQVHTVSERPGFDDGGSRGVLTRQRASDQPSDQQCGPGGEGDPARGGRALSAKPRASELAHKAPASHGHQRSQGGKDKRAHNLGHGGGADSARDCVFPARTSPSSIHGGSEWSDHEPTGRDSPVASPDPAPLAKPKKPRSNNRTMRCCSWCLFESYQVRAQCLVCNLAPGAQPGRVQPKFVAVPPIASACAAVARLTNDQRRDAVHQAAARSDTARLTALHAAGAPLDLRNEYGFTPLHEAAWHGGAAAVRRLGALGADPRPPRAYGGVTPATAAAANGHGAVLAALEAIGADMDSAGSEGVPPVGYIFRRGAAPLLQSGTSAQARCTESAPYGRGGVARRVMEAAGMGEGHHDAACPQSSAAQSLGTASPPSTAPLPALAALAEVSPCLLVSPPPLAVSSAPANMHWLIGPNEPHAGAGSVIIDNGFPQAVLSQLDTLFAALPLAPRYKCTQGLNDRAYFCDAERWVRRSLAAAVAAGARNGSAPVEGKAMPHMRFLLYAEAGGGLPPHVDLSRTDDEGRTSSHTFILYLTGCQQGGSTVLLDQMRTPSAGAAGIRASIMPVRGRLLLFPHMCPHLAQPVLAEGLPKLLLRGEMF